MAGQSGTQPDGQGHEHRRGGGKEGEVNGRLEEGLGGSRRLYVRKEGVIGSQIRKYNLNRE